MTRCAGRATQGNVAAVVTEAFETWTKWRYIKQNSQRFNRCLFWAANQKKHFSSRRKIEHLNYGQVFVELDHWVSHNKPLGPSPLPWCFVLHFSHILSKVVTFLYLRVLAQLGRHQHPLQTCVGSQHLEVKNWITGDLSRTPAFLSALQSTCPLNLINEPWRLLHLAVKRKNIKPSKSSLFRFQHFVKTPRSSLVFAPKNPYVQLDIVCHIFFGPRTAACSVSLNLPKRTAVKRVFRR